MVTPNPDKVAALGVRGSPFLDSEQQVFLRMRAAKTGVASRAPLLVLHMHSAARQICLAVGGNYLGNQYGVTGIPVILRNYFAPDAADAIYRQVMRSTHFRRVEQSVAEQPSA